MSKPDNWAQQGKKYKVKFMNSHTVRSMSGLLKHLVGRQTNIGHGVHYRKKLSIFKKNPVDNKCLKEIELSISLSAEIICRPTV